MRTRQDLEERTFNFAANVRDYVEGYKSNRLRWEYVDQVLRSSASIGANYIEGNESFSAKDFLFRMKICIKEAKETIYWLRLFNDSGTQNSVLIDEARQLMNIFASIARKASVT